MHDAVDQRPDRVLTKTCPAEDFIPESGPALRFSELHAAVLITTARLVIRPSITVVLVSEEQGESPAGGLNWY
ncbi:MAG TPA: hypothetical protein VNB87_01240 [Propionibacteriaceae bacterium]|jgi:hypothetical protein|nr:hypothetical protein [Propionibacteriaceae bacterium]